MKRNLSGDLTRRFKKRYKFGIHCQQPRSLMRSVRLFQFQSRPAQGRSQSDLHPTCCLVQWTGIAGDEGGGSQGDPKGRDRSCANSATHTHKLWWLMTSAENTSPEIFLDVTHQSGINYCYSWRSSDLQGRPNVILPKSYQLPDKAWTLYHPHIIKYPHSHACFSLFRSHPRQPEELRE